MVEENGTKRGGNWEKTGRKMGPIFHRSISPIFLDVEDSLLISLCKNQRTALTDGKKRIFATHRHSPPRQLVRMLVHSTPSYNKTGAHLKEGQWSCKAGWSADQSGQG